LVCENQSFVAAANTLDVSPTMISRYIKQLEQEYGCLLFTRNTRKVFLTEAGEQYRNHITTILEKLKLAEREIAEYNDIPQGKLTISASIEFGGIYLAPLIKKYREKFPHVQLQINLTNTPVDLLESGTDLVFRVAPTLSDSNLIAQPICFTRLALWASQKYLSKNGLPKNITELKDHQLLFFSHSVRKNQWIFSIDDQHQTVKLPWAWSSNNGRLLNEAAAAGQGIIQAPNYSVDSYVRKKQLVEVMPELSVEQLSISAVYPHRYDLSSRIKTFVEMAKQYFSSNPI